METLRKDIIHGLRLLWKNPAFTLVAALTLALGIGANTAIFSMVDSLLLRPMPVPHAEQMLMLAYQQKHGSLQNQFSIADYRDIAAQSGGEFSGMAGAIIGMDGLSVNGKADRVMTNYVSGNFFSVMGVQPAVGRLLLPSEGETPGSDPVIVLGYSYWQQRFGGDRSIVGQKVLLNGSPMTIVGVAPKGFYGSNSLLDVGAYLPMGMQVVEGVPADYMVNRGLRNMVVLGRLQDGKTLAQANAALAVVGHRLAEQYPQTDKDFELSAYLETRSRPQPDPQGVMMMISGLFLGLAGLVLLLACLNVANILLVRATIREKEMAIRAALGAARGRLIRQLLTESILLAMLGAVGGVLLGFWASSALGSLNIQTDLPVRFDFGLDWRVFAYGLVAALATGLIVGIVPALRISRGDLNKVLHQSSRGVVAGGNKLRTTLVIAQVAGSLTLLVIAGLFTRSLAAAQKTNLGFDPRQVVNLTMDPSEIGYRGTQVRDFYKNLLSRVEALPGVEAAAFSNGVPMGYYNNGDSLVIEGYDQPAGQPPPGSLYQTTTPDYLRVMKIPLLRGRMLTAADDESAPYVAVINQAMADKYWTNQDPIGKRFQMLSDRKHWLTIVGVSGNARQQQLTGKFRPFFYIPFLQHFDSSSLQVLQVRSASDPQGMMRELREAVRAAAPDLPLFDVMTMTQALNTLNGLMMYQLGAGLAAVMGALGLVLSVVGVYGVISYSAAQRTQEIGIRLALGAQPGQIARMVLRQGIVIVAVGLGIGLAAAFALARLASGFLAVSPSDPVTYASVTALLTAVALLACYVPARRTMRVDPMVALRYE